jgi:prepilin-type N-terminal cleavage/methylation domain-containing protein
MANKKNNIRTTGKAFTLVELLVVISIIAMLIGIMVPVIGVAKKHAKTMTMKATLGAIGVGLEQFRNDQSRYPDSSVRNNGTNEYCLKADGGVADTNFIDVGAHRLAEAMFGIDMLGYSSYQVGGINYYNVNATGEPCDDSLLNAIQRADAYIDISSVKIGKMTDVIDVPINLNAEQQKVWGNPYTPVILDNFSVKKARPILYYKANTGGNLIHDIYKYYDNAYITNPFMTALVPYTGTAKDFYNYIWDTETGIGAGVGKLRSPSARPYNRDSFLLISAGPDGEYGTQDDICNFERRD